MSEVVQGWGFTDVGKDLNEPRYSTTHFGLCFQLDCADNMLFLLDFS
jgi:hypothetical protein